MRPHQQSGITRWQSPAPARGETGRVANVLHFATWMSSQVIEVLAAQLGTDWADRADRPGSWDSVLRVDDAALWRAHGELKAVLLRVIREEARRRWAREGGVRPVVLTGTVLDPDVLTIGLARPFMSHKRAPLMFRALERLAQLVTNWRAPVQLVVAGRPHPADELVQAHGFGGRIVFVDDAARHITQHLVQGVDLWLNVPRAHGTRSLTAALNAVPELSTPDAWWAAECGEWNGWEVAGDADVAGVYHVLEEEIVPLFYARDARDIPLGWVARMKHTLRLADPRLTALRMVRPQVTPH
jgi:starch phosphorylase